MYDGIIEMSMRIAERRKILCNEFRKLLVITVEGSDVIVIPELFLLLLLI
jgi:hypothetical protein